MKRLLLIFLMAISCSSYAIDIELLKQSLVGSWNHREEERLNFYFKGEQLIVRYVADYSWVWGYKDRGVIINEYGTCPVKVNNDGTIEFEVKRMNTGHDKKGKEERKEYFEYSYKLSFVDGTLIGSETWNYCFLKTQPMNEWETCRFSTIERAEKWGHVSEFPFGNKPYTIPVMFSNPYKTNIQKFYKNGIIDELSNCNPEDYRFGFLFGEWFYTDNALWKRGNLDYSIKIFARDGDYYVKYLVRSAYAIVKIYPTKENGKITFSFDTKQEFIGRCEEYDWPWIYIFNFDVTQVSNDRLEGYRERTSVSGPIKACDIPEPEKCRVVYEKRK